jgi:hypothetical protein
MKAADFRNPYAHMAGISRDAFRTRDEEAEQCHSEMTFRTRDEEFSPEQLQRCKLEAAAEKIFGPSFEAEKTVKRMSRRRHFCLTVNKLSRLQRFILKAAFSNRTYKALLPSPWKSSWNKDAPWRDITDEEIALLYYDLGEYEPPRSEPTSAYKIFGVTIPGQEAGFSRHVRNRDVSREVKGKARAAISRAMKRLKQRGLIERFGQNRDEGVFYASCNLTLKGFQVAERLAGEPTPERKSAIRSGSRIAPEDTKTAANASSARTVPEIGAAASQEDCRHASL